MKKTINRTDFFEGFEAMGRAEQFSNAALDVLYDYLNQLEDDIGESIEFDVIALCCDYAELDLDDINQNYRDETEPFEDMEEAIEWLEDQTTVIPVDDDTVVIQQF